MVFIVQQLSVLICKPNHLRGHAEGRCDTSPHASGRPAMRRLQSPNWLAIHRRDLQLVDKDITVGPKRHSFRCPRAANHVARRARRRDEAASSIDAIAAKKIAQALPTHVLLLRLLQSHDLFA